MQGRKRAVRVTVLSNAPPGSSPVFDKPAVSGTSYNQFKAKPTTKKNHDWHSPVGGLASGDIIP